jgi:hypothetical protein
MEGMVPSDSCHFSEALKTFERPHVRAADAPERLIIGHVFISYIVSEKCEAVQTDSNNEKN